MLRTRALGLLPALLLLAAPERASATLLDGNWTESVVATDTAGQRTALAWAPDGSDRLFVVDKLGTVRIASGLTTTGTATWSTFATMSPIVTAGQCGLLGIAFDPNFAVNHYVYFFVTVSATEQQILRYDASTTTGTGRTVVVSGLPTLGTNNTGGALAFGPDGRLYWGIGDLAASKGLNGDLASLASKIGRANRDGSIPLDNPFYDGAGPNNDYVWARGVRNPFSMAFQSSSGQLWANVAGITYEQVFAFGPGGGHGGWSAYEANQPAGFLRPVLKYRDGNKSDTATVSSITRTGGVLTGTTSAAHLFAVGEKLTLAGFADTTLNGTVYVASTPTATTFTAAQTGADTTGTGGTAQTTALGGVVTAGAFLDVTGIPGYAGSYFFGDFLSGSIVRAGIDGASNTIKTVDVFASGASLQTAMAVGPDGGLYYTGLTSTNITAARFDFTSNAIIASRANVQMDEGGKSIFTVRLAKAPAADVTVGVARTSGDTDVTVGVGSTLSFTTSNWNVPQIVRVDAANDGDGTADVATLSLSATGLSTETVKVNVTDKDATALVLSTPSLLVNEGSTNTFTVQLLAAPSGPVTVNLAASGDPSVTITSGSTLNFTTGNWSTPQTVTIAAANDANVTSDLATITATAAGLATRTVSVVAVDKDGAAPVITSTPITTGTAGVPYAYTVTATGVPTPTFSLVPPVPAGMTIDATSGAIAWTPAAAGTFAVTVQASNGTPPNATQTFSVVVAAAPDAGPDGSTDASETGATDAVADASDATDSAMDTEVDSTVADSAADTEIADTATTEDTSVAMDSSTPIDTGMQEDGDVDAGTFANDNVVEGSGCGCRTPRTQGGAGSLAVLGAALVIAARRRRRS